MLNLKGRTALITGGTSGIGRAVALAAADAGANVVITGRRGPEGAAVVDQLRSRSVKAAFVQGDVTDERHVENAVAEAVRIGGGRFELALNNAGLELANLPTADATPEQYRRVFDVNVLGVLLSMKHEIRAMTAAGVSQGSIVNTASVAGTVGMPGVGIYIASKHAVLGLTKSAALEVARSGIRVNAVSPAAIETEMFDRFTGKQPEATTYMAGLHPIGRIGRPDEVAHAVLFLFSSESSFITGHDLKVDGALTVP